MTFLFEGDIMGVADGGGRFSSSDDWAGVGERGVAERGVGERGVGERGV